MNVAFLSLGGNMGNRMENLSLAFEAITAAVGEVTKRSSLYETAAWGVENGQPYLNQVLKVNTTLSIHDLLRTVLNIEKKIGRIRQGHQYSDRIIDIDILFFNNDIVHEKDLWVPHARLHLRKFALVPLEEIEKDLIHPELKKTIHTLLKECKDDLDVKKVVL